MKFILISLILIFFYLYATLRKKLRKKNNILENLKKYEQLVKDKYNL